MLGPVAQLLDSAKGCDASPVRALIARGHRVWFVYSHTSDGEVRCFLASAGAHSRAELRAGGTWTGVYLLTPR